MVNSSYGLAIDALKTLLEAKRIKEEKGKTPEYIHLKNEGWDKAEKAISSFIDLIHNRAILVVDNFNDTAAIKEAIEATRHKGIAIKTSAIGISSTLGFHGESIPISARKDPLFENEKYKDLFQITIDQSPQDTFDLLNQTKKNKIKPDKFHSFNCFEVNNDTSEDKRKKSRNKRKKKSR